MPVLIVTDIIHETHDVRTYVVKRADGASIEYKAGQFITLIIDLNGRELRRSYSISTCPGYDEHVAFTIKLITNGEVSRHLFRTITVGSEINTELPGGRFVAPTEGPAQRDIFLFAAGSGVTPVFSLLKFFLTCTNHPVKLVLQNHTVSDVIFHDKLNELANLYTEKFHFFNFISVPPGPGWPLRKINNELLEHLVNRETGSERSSALFYICGPLPFMRMAEFTLRQMGFDGTQIKKEIFAFPQTNVIPFEVDQTPRKVQLQTKDGNFSFLTQFPQTILDAALANLIHIPFSCRAGLCGSCVLQCSIGKIRMKTNEVLTDEEVKAGLVLTCVGYALEDVIIRSADLPSDTSSN